MKIISVTAKQLFLDPNNPRFSANFCDNDFVDENEVESLQPELQARFLQAKNDDKEEDDERKPPDSFLNISDLLKSIETVGFYSSELIVVRNLPGSNNYLVVEGNRRTAAIKHLIKKGDLSPSVEKSLSSLDVAVISNDPAEINKILGARHFVSGPLAWGALPRARDFMKTYMKLLKTDEFKWSLPIGKQVAKLKSVAAGRVEKALRGLIAYEQLQSEFGDSAIIPDWWSIIEATVTNATLRGYLNIDPKTYRLPENSLEKLNAMCQFEKRARFPIVGCRKILQDPKSPGRFARLVKDSLGGNFRVRAAATAYIVNVLDEDDLENNLTHVLYLMKKMKKAETWVPTLETYLAKVDLDDSESSNKKLLLNQFNNEGNDKLELDRLNEMLDRTVGLLFAKEKLIQQSSGS